MPSRTASTPAMYSSGAWSETMSGEVAVVEWRVAARGSGFALNRRGGQAILRELVGEALDLLLLAVHEVDVVAEEEVQVLLVLALQLQVDGVELEQQIVAEGADEGEARVLVGLKPLDGGGEDREGRGLLAALLFGE